MHNDMDFDHGQDLLDSADFDNESVYDINDTFEQEEINPAMERAALLRITALSSQYCLTLENASSIDRPEFVKRILSLLPRIYFEFLDLSPENSSIDDESCFSDYVDEDYYDSIRRNIENLFGPDDVYLETFEEDMKYSDTPIAASIAEGLADIFQPLYNFAAVVRETEGDRMKEAYLQCRDDFAAYWSRTLCNVLRALNAIYFK